MKYIEEINSPFLAIYPDCGNITNACLKYEINIVDDINSAQGHIVSLHLKESLPDKFREIPLGLGHVNFNQVLDTVSKLGVNIFGAEFWYAGDDDWEKDLHFASQFLSQKIKIFY